MTDTTSDALTPAPSTGRRRIRLGALALACAALLTGTAATATPDHHPEAHAKVVTLAQGQAVVANLDGAFDDVVAVTSAAIADEAVRRAEAERVEAARVEAERVAAEAARAEAERAEAERIEAARIEAERAEAARVEAARVEAQRVETERAAAEQAQTARAAAERTQIVQTAPAAVTGGANDPAGTQVWHRLAGCEASGDWTVVSASGQYRGGLQFSQTSWEAVGGTGRPEAASVDTQIEMGRRLQARQGWGAWPHCSQELGLR